MSFSQRPNLPRCGGTPNSVEIPNGLPADDRQAVLLCASPKSANTDTLIASEYCPGCRFWVDFSSSCSAGPCPGCAFATIKKMLSAPSYLSDEGAVAIAFIIDGKGDFRVRDLGE